MIELLIIGASFFIGLEGPKFLFKPIRFVKRKLKRRRLKPFDCEACFGFWTSICISLFATDILSTILIGIITFNLIKRYCIYALTNEKELH